MTNLAHQIDPSTLRYTVEEYLAYDREAEVKHEYFDGRIEMMAGGKPTHSLIASNVGGELRAALRGSSCRTYNADLRVQSFGRHFYYPDVTVVCGDLEYYEGADDVVTNASLIVEVLSPSTERNDRVVKWMRYQKMPTLRHYLLVWQSEPQVEHFYRGDDGEWRYESVVGLDATLQLRSLNVSLRLADLYEGVTFPSDAEETSSDQPGP